MPSYFFLHYKYSLSPFLFSCIAFTRFVHSLLSLSVCLSILDPIYLFLSLTLSNYASTALDRYIHFFFAPNFLAKIFLYTYYISYWALATSLSTYLSIYLHLYFSVSLWLAGHYLTISSFLITNLAFCLYTLYVSPFSTLSFYIICIHSYPFWEVHTFFYRDQLPAMSGGSSLINRNGWLNSPGDF